MLHLGTLLFTKGLQGAASSTAKIRGEVADGPRGVSAQPIPFVTAGRDHPSRYHLLGPLPAGVCELYIQVLAGNLPVLTVFAHRESAPSPTSDVDLSVLTKVRNHTEMNYSHAEQVHYSQEIVKVAAAIVN